jgi:hypothetical protein
MIHLTDTDVHQECSIEIGTRFWEDYKGLTMCGFGKVSKCWEVVECLGDDLFLCKQIYNNAVSAINKEYREPVHISTIIESFTTN